MLNNDPVLPVVDALNALKIPYMMVGSYSSNLHGIPRGTRDADFVVEMATDSISLLAERLTSLFKLDPQMGFETVTFHRRWVFHHRLSEFKLEMFLLVDQPFDRERFQRRQRHTVQGRDVWFQTPEDVIVNKLRWGRAKDLIDAGDVIGVQGDGLDWNYIERWCGEFGRMEMLAQVRREAAATSMDDTDMPPSP